MCNTHSRVDIRIGRDVPGELKSIWFTHLDIFNPHFSPSRGLWVNLLFMEIKELKNKIKGR